MSLWLNNQLPWRRNLQRKPSPSNGLGESYVSEVQRNGKHVPLFCTDMEDHEHLTNHSNEHLNMKILDTFKDSIHG